VRTASRGALATIALLAVIAAGCDSGGASSGASMGTTAPPRRAAATRLEVTYYPHGSAKPAHRWALTCSPTGGDHPRRTQACAELAAHPHALGPARRACRFAAVRGAPQALVSGTHRGAHVNHLFRPGCDPEWTSLHALLRGR
jgi:hypothetical protein